MKKLLCILLGALLGAGAAGCGQRPTTTPPPSSSSPASEVVEFSQEEVDLLAKHAITLTKQLVEDTFGTTQDKKEVTEADINCFVLLTVRHREEPQYLYHDFFTQGEDLIYRFPVKKVQQLVSEVFGVDDWSIVLDSVPLNQAKDAYESGLEFGIGSLAYLCKDITVKPSEDGARMEGEFLLADSGAWPGPDGETPASTVYGRYRIVFQMLHGADGPFLRFVEVTKS